MDHHKIKYYSKAYLYCLGSQWLGYAWEANRCSIKSIYLLLKGLKMRKMAFCLLDLGQQTVLYRAKTLELENYKAFTFQPS